MIADSTSGSLPRKFSGSIEMTSDPRLEVMIHTYVYVRARG